MYAPRFHIHLSRAVALGLSINLLGPAPAPPAAGQFVMHSEQGATPPPTAGIPDTFTLTSVATGLGPMRLVVGPGINGFDSTLYVLLLRGNRIVTITPFGMVGHFTTLPRYSCSGVTSMVFDLQGNYNGSLLLNANLNRIGAVAPTGEISFLRTRRYRASSGELAGPVALGCDPYGAFGGGLFVAESTGSVLEVGADGQIAKLTQCYGGGHLKMLFSSGGAFGQDLYIADTAGRRIFRIPPDHVPGEVAPTWLDLVPLGIEPYSLAISRSGPFGQDVMYVSEAHGGRIMAIGPAGQVLGVFISGLDAEPSIELPANGPFGGTMVVAASGDIWVIHPIDAPIGELDDGGGGGGGGGGADVDGDLDVDVLDLRLLLANLHCLGPSCAGDIDASGTVDWTDLDLLLKELEVAPYRVLPRSRRKRHAQSD